jgi:VCBS repeat-containing protein
LANDTDPQGHRLAATLISGPAHGRLTLRADGSFTYTPTSGFSGVDQFVYSAKDSGGRSDRATVTIKVGHFDHDGCGHDQHHYGHHDRDGCAHDREDHDRDRHSDGDRCDHEQRRRGHYDGDGCDHDRRWRR